jgi:hypothetical protein
MKKCTMCGEEKPLTEFAVEKNNKTDGRRSSCKVCTSQRIRQYFIANPEKKKESDKRSYEENKAKKLAQKKEYYLRKKEEILAKRKEYHLANKEVKNQKSREYRENNLEKVKAKNREYHKKHAKRLSAQKMELIKSDPLRIFKERIRVVIRGGFVRLKQNKARRTNQIIGADWETVRDHIVSQFKDGMTWEAFVAGEIHIDHIKPLASATCEEDIIALNHYTNLQPLWCLDNLSKGATFEGVNYKTKQ